MALYHAQHADDDAARDKQEVEITKLYFANRQEAHARLRGGVLSVSLALTATFLHEFYSALATDSILSIDDALWYVTRSAHDTYQSFLAAARRHEHTGAFWHDLGLRAFCACTTDRCALECRQGGSACVIDGSGAWSMSAGTLLSRARCKPAPPLLGPGVVWNAGARRCVRGCGCCSAASVGLW